MRKISIVIFAAVVGFVFIFDNDVQRVWAQDASDNEFTLEEITVTAQKREEDMQDVPITMDVILGGTLEREGRTDIEDALSKISTILFQKTGDGVAISLRGVAQHINTPSSRIQMAPPSVALNMDGVFSYNLSVGNSLFDIERIEVLYGPQSTIYASATPGGVVNVKAADPKLDRYEVMGSIQAGSYDQLQTEAVINVPLGEKWGIRSGFQTRVRDGYLSNGADDEDIKLGRVKILYQPNDKISFVLTGETQKVSDRGKGGGVVAFANQDDVDDPWIAEALSREPRDKEVNSIYGHINGDLGFATFTAIPSFSKTNEIYKDITGIEVETRTEGIHEQEEKGFEGRFVSPDDFFFDWIAGFTWGDSHRGFKADTYIDDVWNRYGARAIDVKHKAVYANITYPVTDKSRVTGGIRYSDYDQNIMDHNIPGRGGGPPITNNPVSYTGPDYKVGVEHDLNENVMFYADWSTGFVMATSGVDKYGNALPPETLDSYTIGSKNRFFNERLQINVSAYYYQHQDQNMTYGVDTIEDENGNGIRDWDDLNGNGIRDTGEPWLENSRTHEPGHNDVGDLDVKGFDFQGDVYLTNVDKMGLSISYNDKKWDGLAWDRSDISNWMGYEDVEYSGSQGVFSPNWKIRGNYEHIFQLENGGKISTNIDLSYTTSTRLFFRDEEQVLTADLEEVVTIYTADISYQEPYYLGDISATYTSPDGKWTLSAFVKNITNYAVKTNLKIGRGTTSDLMLGPPRTYGVNLRLRY